MQIPEQSGTPPVHASALSRAVQIARPKVSKVMTNWQIAGFSLGVATSLALDSEDWRDFDPDVLLDYLDEILHADEEIWDDDKDTMSDELMESDQGPAIRDAAIGLMYTISLQLEENEGQPPAAILPLKKNKDALREFAAGLVRGLVFGVEDESELESGPWGEAFSLLFILSEQDRDPDFGSAQEIGEARAAIADALPGLIAEIWNQVREIEQE
jgi:hypothetical protein